MASTSSYLAADIALFDKQKGKSGIESEHYLSLPPAIVIEVDLKADVSDFASPLDYYTVKTNKLLSFGVEQVIWISTQSRTVMTAESGQSLKMATWEAPIHLIPGVDLYLNELVQQAGYGL